MIYIINHVDDFLIVPKIIERINETAECLKKVSFNGFTNFAKISWHPSKTRWKRFLLLKAITICDVLWEKGP